MHAKTLLGHSRFPELWFAGELLQNTAPRRRLADNTAPLRKNSKYLTAPGAYGTFKSIGKEDEFSYQGEFGNMSTFITNFLRELLLLRLYKLTTSQPR